MARRCCCLECLIFEDDFNRAESTDLGANWDEVSGNWDLYLHLITVQLLRAQGAGIAIAGPHRHKISFYVTIDVIDEQVGGKYQVVVNYLDSNNYYFAELEVLGNGHFNIGLYKITGGAPAALVERADLSTTPAEDYTFYCCFTKDIFVAAVDSYVWVAYDNPGAFSGGYQAGVGSGSSTTICMDDFHLEEHWSTNHDCPRCVCYCKLNPVNQSLTLTVRFTGDDEFAICFDPIVITLTYDNETGFWHGEACKYCYDCDNYWGNSCSGCNGDPNYCYLFTFHLSCETGESEGEPVGGFRLDVNFNNDPQTEFSLVSMGASCDPLVLEFPTFHVGYCCKYSSEGPTCEVGFIGTSTITE